MASNVEKCPKGYHTLTPYLSIKGAAQAMEFYKTAFGATEVYSLEGPGGTISHAEMSIGDSRFMLADESPMRGNKGPTSLGGTPVSLMMYVDDSDAVFERAVKAGATVALPVQTHFYGDRSGTVVDPFGHKWDISTHVEDVSPEEVKKRMAALCPPNEK
eukprot:TRINITY_DN16294_c0_g1_i1.p2 TRINITY_DN16294_c0_g1~~TRINITY_DN16294_c0_g1_i1.p2  ORF type:complete len:159 (+),score=54.57 TRINITY_DN16294_c0_g1_i1:247-723(+)